MHFCRLRVDPLSEGSIQHTQLYTGNNHTCCPICTKMCMVLSVTHTHTPCIYVIGTYLNTIHKHTHMSVSVKLLHRLSICRLSVYKLQEAFHDQCSINVYGLHHCIYYMDWHMHQIKT